MTLASSVHSQACVSHLQHTRGFPGHEGCTGGGEQAPPSQHFSLPGPGTANSVLECNSSSFILILILSPFSKKKMQELQRGNIPAQKCLTKHGFKPCTYRGHRMTAQAPAQTNPYPVPTTLQAREMPRTVNKLLFGSGPQFQFWQLSTSWLPTVALYSPLTSWLQI